MLCVSIAYSQNTVVLLSGKISDCETGLPLAERIMFKGKSGNYILTKANSTSGEYQQVLQAGETYNIYYEGYLAESFNSYVSIADYKEYKELSKDICVKKIRPEQLIISESLFKKRDTLLTEGAIATLHKIKDFLNVQKKLKFNCFLLTNPSEYKAKKIKQKMPNGKIKQITISSAEQAKEINETRMTIIVNELKKMQARTENVNFSSDKTMTAKEVKSNKNISNTLKNNENIMIIITK